MQDSLKALHDIVKDTNNQVVSNFRHVKTKAIVSADSLQSADSVRLSKYPISIYYSEEYVYPQFKSEALDAIPYTSIDYLDKPMAPRNALGFINSVGFNFSIQLLLMLYFFYALRGKFESTIQVLWSSSKLERYFNEKELRKPLFFWMVYLSISLSMTLPIMQVLLHYKILAGYEIYFPHSIWAFSLYIALCHVIYFILTYALFVVTGHAKHYRFWMLARVTVMWVVAVVGTLLYGLSVAFEWSVTTTIFAYLLVYLLAYINFLKHTHYMVKERGFSISVWILYLCALEIFPLIAGISLSWDFFTV